MGFLILVVVEDQQVWVDQVEDPDALIVQTVVVEELQQELRLMMELEQHKQCHPETGQLVLVLVELVEIAKLMWVEVCHSDLATFDDLVAM